MKFNCGPIDTTERKRAAYNAKAAEAKKWKRRFAWGPVQVADNDCRWLEFYEVRVAPHQSEWPDGIKEYWWNYDVYTKYFWHGEVELEYRGLEPAY